MQLLTEIALKAKFIAVLPDINPSQVNDIIDKDTRASLLNSV